MRKKRLAKTDLASTFCMPLGEIILVVLGILIAIQIDAWNRNSNLYQEELESYQLIIADLKRDSVLFKGIRPTIPDSLDTYFQLNTIKEGEGSFGTLLPDYLVMNIEFNPITRENHQATIEKFRNVEIREQLSSYFRLLSLVNQATDEFNELVVRESRLFFLKEKNVFANDRVFDSTDRTFPPLKRISTIDTVKLRATFDHQYFEPILSQLRMSMGFYLLSMERSMEENHSLIQSLESKLE